MPSATVHKLKQEQGSGLAIVRACLDAVGAAEFGAAASLHAHRTEPLTSLCSNWHRLRLAPTRLQQSGGGGKHVSGSLATASAASALAQNGTMQGIQKVKFTPFDLCVHTFLWVRRCVSSMAARHRSNRSTALSCTLLITLYGVAFCCLVFMFRVNQAVPLNHRRQTAPQSSSPELVLVPPPPPAPAPQWVIAAKDAEAPLISIRAPNRKYLHVTSRGLVRPAAMQKGAPGALFRPLALRQGHRRAWALVSSAEGRYVAVQAFSGHLYLLKRDEDRHFAVFEMPDELANVTTMIRTLATQDDRARQPAGCLRYPLPQKPPGLVMRMDTPCEGDDASEEHTFTIEAAVVRSPILPAKPRCGAQPPAAVMAAVAPTSNTSTTVPSPPPSVPPTPPASPPRDHAQAISALAAAGSATTLVPEPQIVRIALGVAVRTHELTAPPDLPLLRTFVPSLVETIRDASDPQSEAPADVGAAERTARTAADAAEVSSVPCSPDAHPNATPGTASMPGGLEPGRVFHYTLFLGYDAGDPTFDDPASLASVSGALRDALAGLPVRVAAVRYGGEDQGAPCWVWNKLLARACRTGHGYMYQLNDDLQLITPGWAPRFVRALERSDPPGFGITGPLDLNNERLMTQSFVSCMHLEAFGVYYPWRFKNWYSDDWAATVYAEKTYWQTDVEVDHGATKGPRYSISYEHQQEVQPLVVKGRQSLCTYLQAYHNATNASSRFSPCADTGPTGAAVSEQHAAAGISKLLMRVKRQRDAPRRLHAQGATLSRMRRAASRRDGPQSQGFQKTASPDSTREGKRERHARLLAAVAEWKARSENGTSAVVDGRTEEVWAA